MRKILALFVLAGVFMASTGVAQEGQDAQDVSGMIARVRRLECAARNGRGQVFAELGTDAPSTQDRAVAKCYSFGSSECFALGCRVVYVHSDDSPAT